MKPFFRIQKDFFQSLTFKILSSFYLITLAQKISHCLSANHNSELRCVICTCIMLIVLYVSVTNTKAYATLVTEHNVSGYVLFDLFLFVFNVISVNVDNVIFCK